MVLRKKLNINGPALVFVTSTTKDWLPVFRMNSAADILASQISETAEMFDISVVGYVIMPSHFHALLGFPEVLKLSKFMQSLKSLSARKIKRLELGKIQIQLYEKGVFQLWQPRFDDLVITSERQLKVKLEYIHNNPVKAGLVANPCGWRYSSAVDWSEGNKGLIKIDKQFGWQ